MRVQKFEGLPKLNQDFKSRSNENQNKNIINNRKFYDMDSVDFAMKTDSIDDPILPQIVRKFKKAYSILFPEKVIEEAKTIRSQIDEYVEGPNFQAVA